MSRYKLLALDMDGTLLHEARISEENQHWIKQAVNAGVTVCMATGRGRGAIVPFMDLLDLNTPFAAVNGSEVWLNKDQLHHRVVMDVDLVEAMYKLANTHDIWFWAYGLNHVYNRDNWRGFPKDEQWLKFGYYTEDETIRTQLLQEIKSWGRLEITNSDPNNLEFNPVGINKSYGIKKMCEIIGCEMEQVVAMGDSMNDIAMIKAAGLGVAMDNAQELVKQAADVVAPSNVDNGVGFIIRKYILGDQL